MAQAPGQFTVYEAKYKPKPDEPVRYYVSRIFRETGFLIQSASFLRRSGLYQEVIATSFDENTETWLFENIKDDSHYYYADGIWFFSDPDAAAIFRLAYGS